MLNSGTQHGLTKQVHQIVGQHGKPPSLGSRPEVPHVERVQTKIGLQFLDPVLAISPPPVGAPDLDHGQINQFQMDPDRDQGRDYFKGMTPEEQHFFMEKRIGKAFNQMMTAFNDMERDERKQLVERTLKRMREDDGEREGLRRLEQSDPAATEKIVNEGLRAYYQDASAETKLDLAPLMEQMQRNLQGLGHRRKKKE